MPVALFKTICKVTSSFLRANPQTILVTLIIAITVIHIHSQNGRYIIGNNLIKHTTIKIKSATVESLAQVVGNSRAEKIVNYFSADKNETKGEI